MDEYAPLEEYGLIGNLDTCALVNQDGSIDWCPFPHLESPSVFARILDAEKGGHFSIQPDTIYESSHQYFDRTNVPDLIRFVSGLVNGTCSVDNTYVAL